MVQALSAGFDGGNYAKIIINDVIINVGKNSNGHYRGLHMVVINPKNGKIEIA